MMSIGVSVREACNWFEKLDLRVKAIWLNPMDGQRLWRDPLFDRGVSQPMMRYALESYGASLLGYLNGFMVLTSEKVPERHIVVLPEGFEPTKLTDVSAAIPLPEYDPV